MAGDRRLRRADGCGCLSKDTFNKVFKDKDAEVAAGPEIAKVFKAADDARRMAKGSNVQDWNQATNLVITGKVKRPDHGRLGAG